MFSLRRSSDTPKTATILHQAVDRYAPIRQKMAHAGKGKALHTFARYGRRSKVWFTSAAGKRRKQETMLTAGTHYIPTDKGWRNAEKMAEAFGATVQFK